MNIVSSLNSVFDEFMAESLLGQRAQNSAAGDENGESENDSDVTIDLFSESEDENNVEIENGKVERDEPEIGDAITSNINAQVDNLDPVTPKDTQHQRMAKIQRLSIVLDRTEVTSQLNKFHSMYGKRNKLRLKRPKKKKLACEICKKKFYATRCLIYNRRIHVKQFSNHCKICLRIFPVSSGLKVDLVCLQKIAV